MAQSFTSDVGMNGPNTATDNAYPRFDNTSGKILQDSKTTEDDNGIISSSQSSARVTLSSAQSIPNNVVTKINFNTITWDIQSEFDTTTNYRFTATVAGKYLTILSTFVSDSVPVGTFINLYIYKNGVLYSQTRTDVAVAGTFKNAKTSDIIDMSATDYLEAFISQNGGASKNISNSGALTFISIHKLS